MTTNFLSRFGLWSRSTELRALIDELAEVSWRDPRWWGLVTAVAAAEAMPARSAYVSSDAAPTSDTFMGWLHDVSGGPVLDMARAVDAAMAARAAIVALDGELPNQPLAVHLDMQHGAAVAKNPLTHAAFAFGDRCVIAQLPEPHDDSGRTTLADDLARGAVSARFTSASEGPTPFVVISVGTDDASVARHGHRRAWNEAGGPWLGIGNTATHTVVSTSHYAIDGYGHAWLCSLIAAALATKSSTKSATTTAAVPIATPACSVPLTVKTAWFATPAPSLAHLTQRLAIALDRQAPTSASPVRFSPVIQVPVAPGRRDDDIRRRRRVVPALISGRFVDGQPESLDEFAHRLRVVLHREADEHGLMSRVLRAGRGLPVPQAWKREVAGAPVRPKWLAPFTELLAGRGCMSLLRLPSELASPALVAVSAPALGPTDDDPLGSCVVTVVETDVGTQVTVTGIGVWAEPAKADALLQHVMLQS